MKKDIIINSTLNELRVAITEDGKLAELFIQLPEKERSIGNIYLGKVTKIIQGINAAFINIGLRQDAFLHFSDVDESLENIATDDEDDIRNEDKQEISIDDVELNLPAPPPSDDKKQKSSDVALRKVKYANKNLETNGSTTFQTKKLGQLQINIEENQDVIVQITREAYSSKGVRVSTKIGIPGRYIVFMPFENLVGVSKKITSYQERRRLRQMAKNIIPPGYGCIIRTVASGIEESDLRKDWEAMMETWSEIEKKVKKSTPPALLYQDMELASSVIRDLFTVDVQRVIVDSKKLHREIMGYLRLTSPAFAEKLELYNGKESIFDAYNIEKELETTYKQKVNLPSGGSIIFNQTEAMFVIDVNSGRSISENLQEQNAAKTNFEAAKEIARQIRLRDIGGMILIDFIDMIKEVNKKRLFMIMKRELARDRAKTTIYPLTKLSIMQLTRRRVNQNITEKMSQACPLCHGSGRIASKAVLMNAIERWLKNFRSKSKEFRLILHVHQHVAQYLTEGTFTKLTRLMLKYFVKINIEQDEHIRIDQFKFISVRRQKDITSEFI